VDVDSKPAARSRFPRFGSPKFSPPGLVSCLVPRSRLFDTLDRGADRRLTLVVGSAGAGKTTLLAHWLAARPDRPTAWLACDVADSDPVRFMAALIEALRRGFHDAHLGDSAGQLLALDGEVSMDLVAVLADDLEGRPDAPVLVIDDYQAAAGSEGVLGDFLHCRPPSLQVVLASRSEPHLRLHRMRAREELVEVRDGDLAFSLDETRAFFSAFAVALPDPEVALVQERTEGWPTGIQMVAISTSASSDPVASVRRGTEARTVAGYFVEEVLSRQPEPVVDFMLATSVLDELTVPACTAITGEGAARMLEHLRSSHLFVTVTDEGAAVYRYHQLIRDVLQDELHARDPGREAAIHETAARHLLEAGRAAAAARHLLAAGDAANASTVLSEQIVRDVLTNPETTSALDLDEIRPELFVGMPEILVPLAAELLWRGAFEPGSRAVTLARQCAVDPERQPELAVRMVLVEMLRHTFVGECDQALTCREAARRLDGTAKGVDDWMVTIDALAMYGHAYLGRYGDARALADTLAAGGTSVALSDLLCTGVVSQVALFEGELAEAAALAERTISAAAREGFDRHYFVFHALRTTAQLALEQRDLPAATAQIERALDIAGGHRPVFSYLAQLDRARIWAAGGSPDAALASVPAARAALKSRTAPLLAEADELEARLRLQLGDHRGALSRARRLPPPRRIVVEAIIALATGDTAGAAVVLRDAPAAPATVRADLELRLLEATVALGRGDRSAPDQVTDALEAAHRQGFRQTVLDTAPQLLDAVIANSDRYRRTDGLAPLFRARSEMRGFAGQRADLVQPLTDAEIRVLVKLAEHLTYADVARELTLSLNTVKTHLRNAYTKLGVSSRSSAIARASVLGLL
jgi:LuxR family maltose regulon positive regulatory protein